MRYQQHHSSSSPGFAPPDTQHPLPHPNSHVAHPPYSRSLSSSSVPPERPRDNSLQYFSTIMGRPPQYSASDLPARHSRGSLPDLPSISQLELPPSPREALPAYGSGIPAESYYQSPPSTSRHSMSPYPTLKPPLNQNYSGPGNPYQHSHTAIVSPPSTVDESASLTQDVPRHDWHRDSRPIQSSPSASITSVSTNRSYPFATIEDHRARHAENKTSSKRSSFSAGITPPPSWQEADDEATKGRQTKRRKSNMQCEKTNSSYQVRGASNFAPPPFTPQPTRSMNNEQRQFSLGCQPPSMSPPQVPNGTMEIKREPFHSPITYRTRASQTTPVMRSPPANVQQPQACRPGPMSERLTTQPSATPRLEPPRLQIHTKPVIEKQRKVVGTTVPGYNGMSQTHLRHPATDGSRSIQETGQPFRSYFFSDVSPTEAAFMTKRPISRISQRALPQYRKMMGGTFTVLDQDSDRLNKEESEDVVILYDKLFRRITVRREVNVKSSLLTVKKSGKFLTVGEAEALRIAADNGIPVPRVFDAWRGPEGYIHISMEHVRGASLESLIHTMSSEEVARIARQLRLIVNKLRRIPVPDKTPIQSCGKEKEIRDLRLYFNHHYPACANEEEFNEFLLCETRSPSYSAADLKSMLRTDHRLHFTHADLMPNNIMIEDGKIVALLDWEFAGWYPEWWEVAKFSKFPGASQWVGYKTYIFDNLYDKEVRAYEMIAKKQKYF